FLSPFSVENGAALRVRRVLNFIEIGTEEFFHVRRFGSTKGRDDDGAEECLGIKVTGGTQDTNRRSIRRINLSHMTSGAVQTDGGQTAQVFDFFSGGADRPAEVGIWD